MQTAYVGDWYEVTNGIPTASYPFNGQAVALKQGATLYYLHRDQVGSLVSIGDASANEVASMRYWARDPTIFEEDEDLLYRGMKATADGRPEIGDSARQLGVRDAGEIPDVEPGEYGMIDPNKPMKGGRLPGMSVAPDPRMLPRHRRPPELGGTGKDPVWSIAEAHLGPDLKYTQDSATHGLIQPSDVMSLDDYRAALAETQADWDRVKPETSEQ